MRTVQVQVTKTYYKSTTVDVEIPDIIQDDGVVEYLEKLEAVTFELSDALADASLNADMDGIEIETY